MKEPKVVERFADNGEHSHYELVDAETGNVLWREGFPQVGPNPNEEDNLFNYEKPILEDEDFDDFNNLQETMSDEDSLFYQLQEEGE